MNGSVTKGLTRGDICKALNDMGGYGMGWTHESFLKAITPIPTKSNGHYHSVSIIILVAAVNHIHKSTPNVAKIGLGTTSSGIVLNRLDQFFRTSQYFVSK